MSFNVNTRLNNLQQQINAITNEGLTNPLQGILDVNGKGLTNVNIIDGGNNIIELKTNNVGGIVLDNPLYTTGDITVNTLHYTALDPPINYNSVTFRLIGSQTVEPTEGNINMYNDNPNSGFITYQSLQSPSLSCSLSLGAGNNIMYIGFSSSSTETTPTYGLYIFCAEGIIQNLTTQISVPLPALTFNLDLSIIGTTMKVFINGTEAVTMQSTIPNVSYYLNCNCYANIGTEIQAQNINYVVNKTENLSDVLAVGNNAGGQNITGVNALTCSQLNYTTLNPPIPTPTLTQVLTAGNTGSNLSMSGLNDIASTTAHISGAVTCGTLNYTTLNPVPPSQWVGTATSNLDMGTYQINNCNQASLVQSPNVYTAMQSNGGSGLKITSATFATQTGIVYDTYYNKLPPSQWVGTATSSLDMNLNPILDTNYVAFAPNGILVPTKPTLTIQSDSSSLTSGFSVCEQGGANPGLIYDSYYNKPTLTNILSGGSDAGNQDITNVKDLTVSKLNYTTLNPPIPTATIPTLTQVLTAGAGAGNLSITGVNNISSIQSNSGDIVNTNSITTDKLFSNDLILNYGSAGSNFQIFGNSDQLVFQQYKGSPLALTNQPIIITDSSNIVFNTGQLLLINSQVLDCKYYTPSLKRPISNTPFTVECNDERLSHIIEVDFPTTSTYTPNYGEVLFTNINITVNSIGPSGPNPFPQNLNAMIYLTNTPLGAYNPSVSNNIVIPMTANKTQTIFVSTIPILLYYYASTAIGNLYCVIKFNGVNPSSDPIYSIVYTLNGVVSGSVCNKTALSIIYGE